MLSKIKLRNAAPSAHTVRTVRPVRNGVPSGCYGLVNAYCSGLPSRKLHHPRSNMITSSKVRLPVDGVDDDTIFRPGKTPQPKPDARAKPYANRTKRAPPLASSSAGGNSGASEVRIARRPYHRWKQAEVEILEQLIEVSVRHGMKPSFKSLAIELRILEGKIKRKARSLARALLVHQVRGIISAWPAGMVITAHEVAKKLVMLEARWAIVGVPTLCIRVLGLIPAV